MTKFGERFDPKKEYKDKPSLILQLQPSGYIIVETPEEVKQWEKDVMEYYGLDPSDLRERNSRHTCYTCSGGIADDCGALL